MLPDLRWNVGSQRDLIELGGHKQERQAETKYSAENLGEECKKGTSAVASLSSPGKAAFSNAAAGGAACLDVDRDISRRVQDWTSATYRALRHFSSALQAASRDGHVRGAPGGRPEGSQKTCGTLGGVRVWSSG